MYAINDGIHNIGIAGQHLPKRCLIGIIDIFWPLPCCNSNLIGKSFVDVSYIGGITFATHCPSNNVVMHLKTVQPSWASCEVQNTEDGCDVTLLLMQHWAWQRNVPLTKPFVHRLLHVAICWWPYQSWREWTFSAVFFYHFCFASSCLEGSSTRQPLLTCSLHFWRTT